MFASPRKDPTALASKIQSEINYGKTLDDDDLFLWRIWIARGSTDQIDMRSKAM